jgi:hypothetical protein
LRDGENRYAAEPELKRRERQTVDDVETPIQSGTRRCEQGWRDFFKTHCNVVFQTALLLTADATAAEAAVAESIDSLDISSPPEQRNLAAWEKAVVVRSIEMSRLSSSAANLASRSMLQPGLLPLIQIEPFPRICFVLRMLLGYSTALSAQILGVEESHVLVLFQMAALQLQQTVAGNRIPL